MIASKDTFVSGSGGTNYNVYGAGDERRFLMHLGLGDFGHPTMSRIDYLLAYQAALKKRTRFDADLNKGTMMKLVQDAIDHERAPRVVIPELPHIGHGAVVNRVNGDSP